MGPKSKPGDEGLPYKSPSEVIGGAPDNQMGEGLKPEHEVSGTKDVPLPPGK